MTGIEFADFSESPEWRVAREAYGLCCQELL